MTDPELTVTTPAPRRVVAAVSELLHDPVRPARRARTGGQGSLRLLAAGIAILACYGLVAGSYAGGASHLVAALKIPLIVGASFLLCLPSLYVLSALSGSRLGAGAVAAAVAGLVALGALVLAALAPVIWLFSVSSRTPVLPVLLNLVAGFGAFLLARRFLRLVFDPISHASLRLWSILVLLVLLQMTTYLRPVLVWQRGQPLFQHEKLSFFGHLQAVLKDSRK